MRPRLVFVHGIGGTLDVPKVRAEWISALADGAATAKCDDFAAQLVPDCKLDVVFAYYGDCFAKPGAQGPGVLDLDEEELQILTDLLVETIDGWLADGLSETDHELLEYARAQLVPVGVPEGAGDLLGRALNASSTLMSVQPVRAMAQWTTAQPMVGHLAQVSRYLRRKGADESGRTLDRRIRDRVLDAIGTGPAVVVAHSLGTVVAMEALHECENPVSLFVTLGSPLRVRTFVWPRLRPPEPRVPDCVARWLNYWDRDDFVVAEPRLESAIRPNSRAVFPETRRIESEGIYVHPAVKYLRSDSVAGPIAAALADGEQAGRR